MLQGCCQRNRVESRSNVGHIKNECLTHEQENAILLHDVNMRKMKLCLPLCKSSNLTRRLELEARSRARYG